MTSLQELNVYLEEFYTYSKEDPNQVIESLCNDETTNIISHTKARE